MQKLDRCSAIRDTAHMTTAHTRLDSFTLRVLRTLFELAQHDRPAHAGALGAELGITRTLAAEALVKLDEAGFVRAEHARLTMRGLVLATRLQPAALSERRTEKNPQLVFGRARALGGLPKARIARVPSRVPAGWERATGT